MESLFKSQRAALIFSLIALAGVVVFALAVGVLMQPAAQLVGQERMSELVCFQLAFTPDRAADIVLSFPEEARAGIGQLLIPGDFTLAWGYGLVLFGLLGLLIIRLPESWQSRGAIYIWAPLLASSLDCAENLFLYSTVQQLVANPELPPVAIVTVMAGAVASLKWIALSVVTPAFGLAGIYKGVMTDRRVRSWIVYVLLFVTLFMMVSKPILDIPACF